MRRSHLLLRVLRQASRSLGLRLLSTTSRKMRSVSPNMQIIQPSAQVVEAMSKLPWDAFGQNTELVTETRALPALFKNEAKVKELAQKMEDEIAKLNAAAKTGDAAAVRTQFNATVKTCDNCHDDFRAK